MKRGIGTGLVLVSALAIGSGAANAQTATDNLSVSITILNACTVDVTGAVAFGSKGSLTEEVTAAGEVTVNCTEDHPYEIALNAGATDGATIEERLMAGTGENTATIKYSLYQDDGHQTVWGETTGVGGNTVTGTGTGTGVAVPVYAKIEQSNTPPADAYSDTVTVTVHY